MASGPHAHGGGPQPGWLFSQYQLSQLQSTVREALREELQAHINGSNLPLGLLDAPSFDARMKPHSFALLKGSSRRSLGKQPDSLVEEQAEPEPDVHGEEATSPSKTLDNDHEQSEAVNGEGCHTVQDTIVSGINIFPGSPSSRLTPIRIPSTWEVRARNLTSQLWFEALIGALIFANSVLVGVQLEMGLHEISQSQDYSAGFFWVEVCFLLIFSGEIVLRLMADISYWRTAWFWFDCVLILTGIVSTVLELILKSVSGGGEVPYLSQILTFRILRLMRLVRAIRTVSWFRELWALCSGLAKSAYTMVSVCILIIIVIYLFACVGINLITKSETLARNPETEKIVQTHFSSVPVVMLTLMQFSNADSISSIYYPLCIEQPGLVIYFLFVWLAVTIALMNLVTAIIVDNALAKGREEAEEMLLEKRKLLKQAEPELRSLFRRLDRDRSGTVTFEEVEGSLQDERVMKLSPQIREYVDSEKLIEIFEFLDDDNSGEINEDEFVGGVCQMALSSVPVETTQMLGHLRHIKEVVDDLKSGTSAVSPRTSGQPRHHRLRSTSFVSHKV